ncbi:MAG: FtsX-like permease family protein [Candidatus Schekmanbacteria bacterium]|nr:FtsX-like permease family protein [Candidatus Schekmanbacteria bacterium]
MQAVAAVGVVAAAFGIVNTLLAAVHERRREIGILQAVGSTRRTLFAAFLLESGSYGARGGALGALIGVAGAAVLGPYLTDNPLTAALRQSPMPAVDGRSLLWTLGLSIGLALWLGGNGHDR